MSKNYFTDEQVKTLIHKVDNCVTYEDIHDIEGFYLDELKSVMNLAVEAAIGEPILFAVPDWEYRLDIYSGQTLCAGKNTAIHKLPLYSVKELEN